MLLIEDIVESTQTPLLLTNFEVSIASFVDLARWFLEGIHF